MTVRWEGAYAKDTSVNVYAAGDELGDETVPEGKIALVLGYDEVFYLEGTRDEILDVLISALEQVSKS